MILEFWLLLMEVVDDVWDVVWVFCELGGLYYGSFFVD